MEPMNLEFKNQIKNIIYNELQLEPSEEQLYILMNLLEGKNVLVNAVAGSGKTTLVVMLGILVKYYHSNQLVIHLTYNRALNEDNKAKMTKHKLKNVVKSYTFHGFAKNISTNDKENYNFYKTILGDKKGIKIVTDTDLDEFSKHDYNLLSNCIPNFLIIDEAQDLNKFKCAFVKQFYDKLPIKPIILVIGDEAQAIYQYTGANQVYVTDFDTIFNIPMIRADLKKSFRLPNELAKTLNKFFIKKDCFLIDKTDENKTDGTLYFVNNNIKHNGIDNSSNN